MNLLTLRDVLVDLHKGTLENYDMAKAVEVLPELYNFRKLVNDAYKIVSSTALKDYVGEAHSTPLVMPGILGGKELVLAPTIVSKEIIDLTDEELLKVLGAQGPKVYDIFVTPTINTKKLLADKPLFIQPSIVEVQSVDVKFKTVKSKAVAEEVTQDDQQSTTEEV